MGASVSYLVVQVALSRFASLVASWNELAMVESSYQMQRPIQECVLLPAAPRASGATWPGWRRWAAPPATPARARPKPASSSRPCRRQIRWAEKNRVREMTETHFLDFTDEVFCVFLNLISDGRHIHWEFVINLTFVNNLDSDGRWFEVLELGWVTISHFFSSGLGLEPGPGSGDCFDNTTK